MSMSLSQRRAAYADGYARSWQDAKLDPNRVNEALKTADEIIANKGRYVEIVSHVGTMPWWMAGALHYRESTLDFDTQMHNGDSLHHRTVHEPVGRPLAPPANGHSYTFEESAIDAFTMTGKHFEAIEKWDIVEVLFRCEQYNGFGYRTRGEPSPYIYAGTNQSDETGKFVSDGHYSSTAHESQLGVMAIMLALQMRGVVLFEDAPPRNQTLPEMTKETVTYVQTRLRDLGYFEVGDPDGKIGRKTNSAVSAFRDEHGLGLSTVIDDDMLAALAKASPRKIAVERATATTSDLVGSVPGIASTVTTKQISGALTGGGLLLTIVQGVASNLSKAGDMLSPIKDALASVPGWAWALVVVAVAGSVFYQSRKAEKETVSAYQRGEIS